MPTPKQTIVSILLAAAVLLAGCTAGGGLQGNATVQPTATRLVLPTSEATIAAPTEPAASAASETTPAAAATETSQEVPQTGTGGLVIAIDPQKSEARYRVREQLANRDLPNDAIGKTNAISGSITVNPDGTIEPASSKFVVDLSSLQSDAGMRDNFVRRNVLQTGQFPNATFVPTRVSGLSWPLPQSGPVTFQVTGDLTIRDVTKEVTWNVTGEIQDSQTGQAAGMATTTFTFADFNLQQPRVPSVLSIADNITLEVDVALQPAPR